MKGATGASAPPPFMLECSPAGRPAVIWIWADSAVIWIWTACKPACPDFLQVQVVADCLTEVLDDKLAEQGAGWPTD